jgi:hypothetical protein
MTVSSRNANTSPKGVRNESIASLAAELVGVSVV